MVLWLIIKECFLRLLVSVNVALELLLTGPGSLKNILVDLFRNIITFHYLSHSRETYSGLGRTTGTVIAGAPLGSPAF